MRGTMRRLFMIVLMLFVVTFKIAFAEKEPFDFRNAQLRSTFDQVWTSGVYKCGNDIDPGKYVLISDYTSESAKWGGEFSYASVNDDANGNNIVFNAAFSALEYIEVREGQFLELFDCYCVKESDFCSKYYLYITEEIVGTEEYFRYMLKVGNDGDLYPGEYRLLQTENSGDAYYCITGSSYLDWSDFIANNIFNNSSYIDVKEGEYIELENCVIQYSSTDDIPISISGLSEHPEESQIQSKSEQVIENSDNHLSVIDQGILAISAFAREKAASTLHIEENEVSIERVFCLDKGSGVYQFTATTGWNSGTNLSFGRDYYLGNDTCSESSDKLYFYANGEQIPGDEVNSEILSSLSVASMSSTDDDDFTNSKVEEKTSVTTSNEERVTQDTKSNSVVDDNPFSVKAEKGIDSTLFDYSTATFPQWEGMDFVVLCTNNNDLPVRMEINATARDNTNVAIGAESEIIRLLPAHKSVPVFMYFKGADETTTYDYSVSVMESDLGDATDKLNVEASANDEGAIIILTNCGDEDLEYCHAYCMFYKNGKLVYCNYEFIGESLGQIGAGETRSRTISASSRDFDEFKWYVVAGY